MHHFYGIILTKMDIFKLTKKYLSLNITSLYLILITNFCAS